MWIHEGVIFISFPPFMLRIFLGNHQTWSKLLRSHHIKQWYFDHPQLQTNEGSHVTDPPEEIWGTIYFNGSQSVAGTTVWELAGTASAQAPLHTFWTKNSHGAQQSVFWEGFRWFYTCSSLTTANRVQSLPFTKENNGCPEMEYQLFFQNQFL